jgi:hypothetical protein
VVHVCVEHSTAAGHPCVRYVSVFSKLLGDLHAGWDDIKHAGENAVHKAVQVVNWLRKEACEKGEPYKCNNITNTASTCEVASFGTMAAGFGPADAAFSAGLKVSGLVGWASC